MQMLSSVSNISRLGFWLPFSRGKYLKYRNYCSEYLQRMDGWMDVVSTPAQHDIGYMESMIRHEDEWS